MWPRAVRIRGIQPRGQVMAGQQRDLFDAPVTIPIDVPRARGADPGTSHEAASAILRSGELGRQQMIVLDAVRRWPGLASIELAGLLNLDRYQVARRLPELESAGLVSKGEPHRTGKRQGVSWWAIEVDVSKENGE